MRICELKVIRWNGTDYFKFISGTSRKDFGELELQKCSVTMFFTKT